MPRPSLRASTAQAASWSSRATSIRSETLRARAKSRGLKRHHRGDHPQENDRDKDGIACEKL